MAALQLWMLYTFIAANHLYSINYSLNAYILYIVWPQFYLKREKLKKNWDYVDHSISFALYFWCYTFAECGFYRSLLEANSWLCSWNSRVGFRHSPTCQMFLTKYLEVFWVSGCCCWVWPGGFLDLIKH